MNRTLRARPDLDQLKRQAKELLESFRAGDSEASKEVSAFYSGADPATFALHHAQLVLARAYGFESWPKLKAYVDGVTVARLAEAVKTGDGEQARVMLKRRPELVHMDMAGDNEHRALHYAVLARQPEMVRLLMQHGADARKGIYPHRGATSALTLATERGYDEIAVIIREEEARRPPDPPEPPGIVPEWGPLTIAVRENRADELARLLESGLDPDERTQVPGLEPAEFTQGAPLWQCAALGRYGMAEMLLARGADPNARVYASGSPMFIAYGHRDHRMIELMGRYGGAVGAVSAGLYRDIDLARRMLAGDADPRLDDGGFVGPSAAEQLLWGAACGGSPEIVRMALERIDWRRDDSRWYRMLEQPFRFWGHQDGHWARADFDRGMYLACFRLMLERADPNLRGRFGRTLLHDVAAFANRMTPEEAAGFAIALLDAGARMDVRDDLLKSTPLGWACRWGRIEIVQLLLARGADPAESEAEPWAVPLAWAEKMGHEQVTALLREWNTIQK